MSKADQILKKKQISKRNKRFYAIKYRMTRPEIKHELKVAYIENNIVGEMVYFKH